MVVTESYIEIQGLQVFARHGVDPQETKVGNEFVVDLRLSYDATQAMATDEVAHALNYATVTNVVLCEMAIPSALLEHVAWRMARALSTEFAAVTAGTITITKSTPPIPTQMAGASFTLSWTV